MSEELEQSKETAKELKSELQDINKEAAQARQTFNDIAANLGKAAAKNKEFAAGFKTAQKDVQDLSSVSAKLSKFDKAALTTAKGRADASKQLNQLAQARTKAQATLNANMERMRNATDEEVLALQRQNNELFNAIETADGLAGSFTEIEEVIDDINSKTNFVSKLAEGFKEIPALGPLLATPLDNLGKGIAQFQVGIDESLDPLEKQQAQLERNSNILDAFAKGGLAFLLTGVINADKAQTKFAKTLGISRSEAESTADRFNEIAISSGKSFITAEKLLNAQMEIAEATGITAGFTEEQLKSQLILTSKLGLAADEAGKLAMFSTLTDKTTKSINTEILDEVANLEKSTGLRIDGREVIKEVANVSGQLSANYRNDPKLIAKAVIQAKKLGLTLEEAKDISESLLDFESSIEAELEAELLTGKALNLERARSLALQGKSAEAAAEIAEQVGSSAEFQEMNVLAQQSLAKAAGMTVDQLADSLKMQELQAKLGDQNIDTLMQTEAGRERLKKLSGEELYNSLQQQAAADKLADAIGKIQSALANMLDGPLGAILDVFGAIAESSFLTYTTIGLITSAIAAQMALKIASQIISYKLAQKQLKTEKKDAGVKAVGAGAGIISAMSKLGPFGAIAGIALAAGAIGFLLGKLAKADDIMSEPSGGGGYGKRILTAPEGTFALNNKDTVIAGTDLFRGDDVVSSAAGSINMTQDNSEAKRTNRLLTALINRPAPKVQMDSIDVGTVAGMSAFSIQ